MKQIQITYEEVNNKLSLRTGNLIAQLNNELALKDAQMEAKDKYIYELEQRLIENNNSSTPNPEIGGANNEK